jgi:hypothetical protein
MLSVGSGEQQIQGIQLHPLMKEELAMGQGQTTEGLLIEWPIGLWSPGSYCISRGRNVEGASQWT